MNDDPIDCIVVGGGPAGLTAAIYLARFHLSTRVIDAGRSRAAIIPRTHNHAGYPDGIEGPELLRRMRAQAERYGAAIEQGEVSALRREDELFVVSVGPAELRARTVLLATGVINRRPEISDALHDEALARGLLRYCPICDGYEVTDKRIGVIGTGDHGAKEAIFLRGYTRDVTLIALDGPHSLSQERAAQLRGLGVTLRDGPCAQFAIEGEEMLVTTGGDSFRFDSLYPALGSAIRSRLGEALGVEQSEEGCFIVDSHQRTAVPGLYAAGDVVTGLDQISHAMGEGGVAATTIRNDLAEKAPLLR